MKAKISDVVACSGAVLMAVALVLMVLDLWTGVAPGAPLTMMLTLGAAGMATGLVRRFEEGSARQVGPGTSLLEVRRLHAELALREQTGDGFPQALHPA